MTADRRGAGDLFMAALEETAKVSKEERDRRVALVEKMIETFVTSGGMQSSDGRRLTKWPPMVDGMSAALDLALEEAAKVVTEHYQELCTEHRLLLVNRAAAIRQLKGDKNG